MKNKFLLLSLLSFYLIWLTGCSQLDDVAVATANVNFNQQQDLSIYKIEEPVAEQKVVPLDPALSYVDTDYMLSLLGSVNAASQRATSDEYPEQWDFVLIDARPANVFAEGHINGSINIPDSQFNAALLPEDKNKLLIFYCGGLACHLSANSAKKAIELGYTNVKVYQEGTPAWKEAVNYLVVTGDYVKDKILEANVVRDDVAPFQILDARPYAMFFDEHIPNAIFADDTLYLPKYLKTAPADKSTEIIIYCGGFTCHKSHAVAEYLLENGYKNVKVYAGGLPDWKKQGLPTFGMASADTDFNVSEGKINRGITPEVFTEKVNSGAFVLDVRTFDEAKSGVIKGALNVPDSEILADPNVIKDKLPQDKNATIVVHCASGARAAGVINKIVDLGYENTFNLSTGITIQADGSFSFPK